MVALLKMIRDITNITNNKKERKESVMAIVESDVELYTIHQGSGESLDEYYKVFNRITAIIPLVFPVRGN